MILVGSMAAAVWHPELWTSPADIDLLVLPDEMPNLPFPCIPYKGGLRGEHDGKIVDVSVAWEGSSNMSFIWRADLRRRDVVVHGLPVVVPSMDWLFALKVSHRYRKDYRHFAKTMRDYHVMRDIGCKIPDMDWLRMRERETYTKARPKLNVSKTAFFADATNVYPYDHDSIHVAVAHLGKPAYEFYKGDTAEVMCSRKKWDECSEDVRLHGVLEEAYVLALERSQIPHAGKISPRDSFMIAMEKVCTSITSGWFRDFAYDNYYTVLAMYSDDYVDKFEQGIKNGTVRKA